jgi:hypothetical protein
MGTLNLEQVAVRVLQSVMESYATPQSFRTLPVFDCQSNNFLLMDEGWEGYQRIHRVWAHIEVKDNKFWIHEDNTEEGIANLLVAEGLSPDQIVLAFYEPAQREASAFAVA